MAGRVGYFLQVDDFEATFDRLVAAGVNPVDDSMHLRSAVGLSVFWTTAIGPLRFNFSKAIDKESYDKEQTFDLTVSTKF